jgi:phytanoyl-CoA hydroxylase
VIDVAAVIAAYRRDGWAMIPGACDPETVGRLRDRADAIQRGAVSYPGLFFQPDSPTGRYEDVDFTPGWHGPDRPYRKIEKLELDPLFRAWIENPLFERLVRAVLPREIALYRAVIFAKAARGGSDLPWHQDAGPFWGLDRDPELQIWTALDDAPEASGCLEIVPGSHRPGLASPLGGIVPAQAYEAADAELHRVVVPARAGDVILLHNHVWHRSGRNQTDSPRRAFTVCYLDADTRCTRRRRAPRTFVRLFTDADADTPRTGTR